MSNISNRLTPKPQPNKNFNKKEFLRVAKRVAKIIEEEQKEQANALLTEFLRRR